MMMVVVIWWWQVGVSSVDDNDGGIGDDCIVEKYHGDLVADGVYKTDVFIFRESRYLLVITENYSALTIVEQQLIKNKDDYVVIFGSSFPKDQEYTQVLKPLFFSILASVQY